MQANGHGPSAAQSPPIFSEQALLASEAKYRSLFESIDQGFCIVEVLFDEHDLPVDYRFAEVNPAFEAQTGLVNAVGRRMRELAPAHEQYWIDIYGRIARTGVPERFENRADALGRWHEVYAFRSGQAEQCHVAILFNDIGPRKTAEAALRESQERLRALLTASSYVLYRMSPDWTEMRQLDGQGFLPDTARPSTTWLQQYIHPSDQPHVMAAIEEAVRTKGMFELEHRVRRVDGSLGWTLSRAVPLLDANGEVTEWFGAASDVTDRKVAEQRHRFLLLLSYRLRVLGEPQSIMDAAVEALGQHLRASCVGYGQAQPGGEGIASNRAIRMASSRSRGCFRLPASEYTTSPSKGLG